MLHRGVPVAASVQLDERVSPSVEPQHSVLLVVGREQFTPPSTFGGETCTATRDCVAVGVRSVDDGPVDVTISPEPAAGLVNLGEFQVETEGLVSVRSVYNKEYDAMGVPPGLALVTVWGNADTEPSEVLVRCRRRGHLARQPLAGTPSRPAV